jgi:hypothetical protein
VATHIVTAPFTELACAMTWALVGIVADGAAMCDCAARIKESSETCVEKRWLSCTLRARLQDLLPMLRIFPKARLRIADAGTY